MLQEDDQTGSTPGLLLITKGLWGIWSRSVFQACLQLGSSPPRSPHTHIALIAFTSFITFIASSLQCVLSGLAERSL